MNSRTAEGDALDFRVAAFQMGYARHAIDVCFLLVADFIGLGIVRC